MHVVVDSFPKSNYILAKTEVSAWNGDVNCVFYAKYQTGQAQARWRLRRLSLGSYQVYFKEYCDYTALTLQTLLCIYSGMHFLPNLATLKFGLL